MSRYKTRKIEFYGEMVEFISKAIAQYGGQANNKLEKDACEKLVDYLSNDGTEIVFKVRTPWTDEDAAAFRQKYPK